MATTCRPTRRFRQTPPSSTAPAPTPPSAIRRIRFANSLPAASASPSAPTASPPTPTSTCSPKSASSIGFIPICPAPTLLRMATLSGAEALGWADETGSLTPGKSADLVVVPLPPGDERAAPPAPRRRPVRVRRVLFRGQWVCIPADRDDLEIRPAKSYHTRWMQLVSDTTRRKTRDATRIPLSGPARPPAVRPPSGVRRLPRRRLALRGHHRDLHPAAGGLRRPGTRRRRLARSPCRSRRRWRPCSATRCCNTATSATSTTSSPWPTRKSSAPAGSRSSIRWPRCTTTASRRPATSSSSSTTTTCSTASAASSRPASWNSSPAAPRTASCR